MADKWGVATTVGTFLTAVSVAVTAWGILREGEHRQVDRALQILDKMNKDESGEEGARLLNAFPGRWEADIKEPLSRQDALDFWKISPKRGDDSVSRRYDVARRHLNRLSDLAFAYNHGIADRKLLEASSCVVMVRSNYYFQHVIKVFGEELGPTQAWQVIPRVAEDMRRAYGSSCRVNLAPKAV